ncbi:hypothetical protein LR002_00845, partial [Candidatus Gracilibacteria bacterium]|nr:hypothetical protein [Candidatus Gracilibacteria bacterium]
MKTSFIKKVSFSMLVATVVVGFTGCGGGGSSSPEISPSVNNKEITVVDGYILNASVKDAHGQTAVKSYSKPGTYIFSENISYPVTATGGIIDLNNNGVVDSTDVIFDQNMTASSGLVISPITTFESKGGNLEVLAQKTGLTVNELKLDYLATNNPEVAKIANLLYFINKENKVVATNVAFDNYQGTESVNSALQNFSVTGVLSNEAANAAIQDLSLSNETNASKIEELVIDNKGLVTVDEASTSGAGSGDTGLVYTIFDPINESEMDLSSENLTAI